MFLGRVARHLLISCLVAVGLVAAVLVLSVIMTMFWAAFGREWGTLAFLFVGVAIVVSIFQGWK